MLGDEQFRQNSERWAESNPDAARVLSRKASFNYQFQTNKDGSLNLKINRNGTTDSLHASNPVLEAAAWFAQQNLRNIKILIVFGVGLGYYYEAALPWLRSDPDHYLVFIENDPDIMHSLLQTSCSTAMLDDDQVWLTYLDEKSPTALQTIAVVFAPRDYAISALNHYKITKALTLEWLREQLDVLMNSRKQILLEYAGSKVFYNNFFRNFALMPQAYLGNKLFGQFKDVPAIICGAGPSLARSLPLLETLKDRAIIFAGGTSMNALNSAGLLPHFGIGVDPNEAQLTRLITNQAFETPYFYRNRMFHEALHLLQGDRLYIAGSTLPLLRWIENKLGLPTEELEGGYNVINLSLAIAQAMGCNPIIFVGVDLAYTDGLSYCPGVLNHPLHERKKYFKTKSIHDELITRHDVLGNPVSTQIKWVTEALWFSRFANKHPEVTLINSSAGGIGFEGIPHLPLDEVAASWLQKRFDFDLLLHEKIQRASMPQKMTQDTIYSVLYEFLESLERCHRACATARTEFQNIAKGLLGDREAGKQPENNALQKLFAEPAYQYMLQFYQTIFIELHTLHFRRLANTKHNFSEKEIALQKTLIYEACYETIAKIAKDTIDLLTKILHTPFASSQQAPLSKGSTMREAHKEFHPDGTLKSLHKFYLCNALHSIEHFSQARLDGRQEYFYPNQTLKSTLDYATGRLHGDVKLYYANGMPKRELSFVNGQRHGKERIWSETGQLLLEAEFNYDRPTQSARQWNSQGQLIKEVTYTSETEYVVREWNAAGSPINENEEAKQDYFDRSFVLLGRLSAQLEQALHQTDSLSSLIEQAGSAPAANLQVIKSELKLYIARASELHLELRQEAQIAEMIWKSPSSQRHLEHQIEELATKANQKLAELQKILSDTVQALIR